MTYVRHRHRMVRQSVFDDVKATLTRLDWLGSTPLAMLGSHPLNLIDYFPDTPNATPLNTLAIDTGMPGELEEAELGGAYARPYTFALMFYAESEATAVALLQDLEDRYMAVTDSPFISLYDYLQEPPTEVVRMEVEHFNYRRDEQNVAPQQVSLYFGELVLTDYVDQAR